MSTEPAISGLGVGRPVRRPLERASDAELVAWHRAGDERGFAELCERHRGPLTAYARSILRTRPEVLEDVVQESLWRAHRALKRDDRHIQVRPYLFRLVRNCCLDELGRAANDSVALHTLLPGDEPRDKAGSTLDHVLRRSDTAALLTDLARLPPTQRHALLRREADGLPHELIAQELGITVLASKNLVHRARQSLTREAAARDTPCIDIRHDLLVAHDLGRRPPMRALRHVVGCTSCRSFRAALKSGRRAMRALVPAPLVVLLASAWAAKAGGMVTGGAKPALLKGAAVAATASVAVSGVIDGTRTFSPGDPSPLPLQGVAVPGGSLRAGAVLPERLAVVTRAVAVAPGATVTEPLRCPGTMRVAGLVPAGGGGVSHGLDPRTVVGASRSARVVLSGTGARAGASPVTVAILCRRPDARGSVRAHREAFGRGPVVFACRQRADLLARSSGNGAAGTVTRGQPLEVLGTRGSRLRVRTDGGALGWLPTSVVC